MLWYAQVALKAAHKQLAALQAQLADLRAAAAKPSGSSSSMPNEPSNNGSSCGVSSRPGTAGGSSGSSDGGLLMQQKLSELEGALRQATSDYALILRELGAMRAEGASRQAGLDAALTDKAAAEAEVKR